MKVLLPLFLQTLAPYVEFLDGCLTEGKLVDDSDEFCIRRWVGVVNYRNFFPVTRFVFPCSSNVGNRFAIFLKLLLILTSFRLSSNVNQGPELWKSVLKTKGMIPKFCRSDFITCVFITYVYLHCFRIQIFRRQRFVSYISSRCHKRGVFEESWYSYAHGIHPMQNCQEIFIYNTDY